jgi:hypothetical protein
VTATTVVEQIMSIDVADFGRVLQPAIIATGFISDSPLDSSRFVLRNGTRAVEISIEPAAALNIASLSLPRLRLRFTFSACSAEEVRQFLDDFLRQYHRGGG